jgi:hypothetical protein
MKFSPVQNGAIFGKSAICENEINVRCNPAYSSFAYNVVQCTLSGHYFMKFSPMQNGAISGKSAICKNEINVNPLLL